jgi:hypothetical protein
MNRAERIAGAAGMLRASYTVAEVVRAFDLPRGVVEDLLQYGENPVPKVRQKDVPASYGWLATRQCGPAPVRDNEETRSGRRAILRAVI